MMQRVMPSAAIAALILALILAISAPNAFVF